MAIKGKIIGELNETSGVSRTGKTWRKKEYILETEGMYPKKICFGVMGDNIDRLALTMGGTYEIEIDVESHEYQGKWYHNVTCWKAEKK